MDVIDPGFKDIKVGIAALFNSLLPVVLLLVLFGDFAEKFEGRGLLFNWDSIIHKVLPVKKRIALHWTGQFVVWWVSPIFQFNQLKKVLAELRNSEEADAHCCPEKNLMTFFFNGFDWQQKNGSLKNFAQEHLVVSCHFDFIIRQIRRLIFSGQVAKVKFAAE